MFIMIGGKDRRKYDWKYCIVSEVQEQFEIRAVKRSGVVYFVYCSNISDSFFLYGSLSVLRIWRICGARKVLWTAPGRNKEQDKGISIM